jgi:predicted neuraminidase
MMHPRIVLPLVVACAASAGSTAQSPVLTSEFIYETAPFPSCHASTIVETGSGLVAAWFGGTAERNPDVGIWVSRHEGGRWTTPVEVANGVQSDSLRYPTWNPVLFQPANGPLSLFYKVGPSPSTWWGMVMTSADEGRSWTEASRLPDGILGPIKNKPVQLAGGEIVAGSSTEHDGWRVHFERSTDGGRTWMATAPVEDTQTKGAIQPSILVHRDGRLQAIGRSRSGRIFETWSSDRGRTWSPIALTDLPNPSAGIDAVTLRDGRHLVVYNHTASGRSPLNVAMSEDGRRWQAALVIEEDTGRELSYPAVIQTRDGLVHITYTWRRERIRHVVLDPARLSLRPIVDGAWPR